MEDTNTRLSRNDKRYSLNGFQKVKAKYQRMLAKHFTQNPYSLLGCWQVCQEANKAFVAERYPYSMHI